MRKNLIVMGKTYRNDKGEARYVHGFPRLEAHAWTTKVQYRIVGDEHEALHLCDIQTFQRWAFGVGATFVMNNQGGKNYA